MMTKPKGKKPADEDEAQSRRFIEAANAAAAAGGLSPTDAEAVFGKAMDGVAKLHREWLTGGADQETPPSEPDPQA